MNDTTLLGLEDMLAATLDSIEVAPDFVSPPDGEYELRCISAKAETYTSKVGKNGARIKLVYAIQSTISTVAGEMPVPDGSLISETLMFTPQGLPYFVTRAIALLHVSDVKGIPVAEILDALEGAEAKARVTTKRTPKVASEPNGAFYENLNIRVIS